MNSIIFLCFVLWHYHCLRLQSVDGAANGKWWIQKNLEGSYHGPIKVLWKRCVLFSYGTFHWWHMNEISECSTDGIEMPSWHLCEETVIHLTQAREAEKERKQDRRGSDPHKTWTWLQDESITIKMISSVIASISHHMYITLFIPLLPLPISDHCHAWLSFLPIFSCLIKTSGHMQ